MLQQTMTFTHSEVFGELHEQYDYAAAAKAVADLGGDVHAVTSAEVADVLGRPVGKTSCLLATAKEKGLIESVGTDGIRNLYSLPGAVCEFRISPNDELLLLIEKLNSEGQRSTVERIADILNEQKDKTKNRIANRLKKSGYVRWNRVQEDLHGNWSLTKEGVEKCKSIRKRQKEFASLRKSDPTSGES